MRVMMTPEIKMALGTFLRGSTISSPISALRSSPENPKQMAEKNETVPKLNTGTRPPARSGVAAPYRDQANRPRRINRDAGSQVPYAPRLFSQRALLRPRTFIQTTTQKIRSDAAAMKG